MKREGNMHLAALGAFQNIGEAVARGDAVGDLAPLLLGQAQRAIGAQAGIVCRRNTPDTIDVLAQYPREKDSPGSDLVAEMLALVAPLLSGERRTGVEEAVPAAELDAPDSQLRCYMEVALVAKAGTVLGAICFADTRAGAFSDEDRQFLNSLAPWIANVMEGSSATPSDQRALASGSEWIGSVAHSLRNPLQRICMVSELLTDNVNEAQQRLISKLDRATDSMEVLITQLEDVLALQEGSLHLESFEADLVPLVHRAALAARELASAKGVVLRGPPQEHRTSISMDSARMEQALSVFLDRVIEAAPGSTVDVTCRGTEHAVHLDLEVQTPAAVPGALSNLLTRSNDLELMIAFGIVRLHGGQMSTALGATDVLTLSISWPHR